MMHSWVVGVYAPLCLQLVVRLKGHLLPPQVRPPLRQRRPRQRLPPSPEASRTTVQPGLSTTASKLPTMARLEPRAWEQLHRPRRYTRPKRLCPLFLSLSFVYWVFFLPPSMFFHVQMCVWVSSSNPSSIPL